jgi:hypothetical protein
LNEFRSYKFKESLYQEILKILLENDEVKLAQMISNKYLAYKDLSLNTKNVIAYLYNESDGYPIQYVYNNYSKLPHETKEVLEPMFVSTYLKAVDVLKMDSYDLLYDNPFLDFDFSDNQIKFKLNELYLEFSEDSRNIILNAMKGIN